MISRLLSIILKFLGRMGNRKMFKKFDSSGGWINGFDLKRARREGFREENSTFPTLFK